MNRRLKSEYDEIMFEEERQVEIIKALNKDYAEIRYNNLIPLFNALL